MAGTMAESADAYLAELRDVAGRVDAGRIEAATQRVFGAWRAHRMVFTCGNGGSAATASHLVCDLVKTASVEGLPRLRAMCLGDTPALLTAIANDVDYASVFLYPLETMAREGDVLIAISCSGNSPNTLRAAEWARQEGVTVISLTGFKGGRLGEPALADVHVNIPSENYGVMEDLHMSVGHMMAQGLRARVLQSGHR